MIVKDLLQKTDARLAAMLQEIGHESVDWTPIILSELTRRSVLRLVETSEKLQISSRRLEKLTWCLVALTIALGILALPPAIEALSQRFTAPYVSAPTASQTAPARSSNALGPSNNSVQPTAAVAPSHGHQPPRPDLRGREAKDRE